LDDISAGHLQPDGEFGTPDQRTEEELRSFTDRKLEKKKANARGKAPQTDPGQSEKSGL